MNRNQNWVLAALLGLGLASGTGRAFAWQETGDKGGETETADAIADRLKAISELFPSQPNARMTPEKLDQAQEQLQALIDDKVPAPRLLVVRQRLAQQQLNAGRMQDALTHLLANIEMLTAEVKTSPAKVGQPLLLNLNLGSSALQRMGKFEEVAPLWRAALTAALSTEATDVSSKGLVSGLRRGLVGALITVGAPGDEARSITQTNLTEARADYEAQPDDAQVASRLAEAMTLEIGVAQREGGDKHLPLVATLLGFLDRQLEKHPDSNVLLAMFLSQRSSQVRDLSRTDPEAALKSLADYVARLNELKDKTEGKSPLITQALAQSKSLERMIESERKRLALIGQPAIPFEAEAWANGEAPRRMTCRARSCCSTSGRSGAVPVLPPSPIFATGTKSTVRAASRLSASPATTSTAGMPTPSAPPARPTSRPKTNARRSTSSPSTISSSTRSPSWARGASSRTNMASLASPRRC